VNLTVLAAAAATFDLLCTGTSYTSPPGQTKEVEAPYEKLYRIDLTANRYCEDLCYEIRPIYSVQPASLELEHKEMDALPAGIKITNTINRITGGHEILKTRSISTRYGPMDEMDMWLGKCARQPFSGFPKISTQF
jgi:hypothetical protein